MNTSTKAKVEIRTARTGILPALQAKISDYELRVRVQRRLSNIAFVIAALAIVAALGAIVVDNIGLMYLSVAVLGFSGAASVLLIPADDLWAAAHEDI